MKFNIILITSICSALLLYGQDSLSIDKADQSKSENIYYSSHLGAYRVSPILTKEKSQKFELKINILSDDLNNYTTDLTNLLQKDTVAVPRVFSFLSGLYTSPKLTSEQKRGKEIKKKIHQLKYQIKELRDKKSYLINRYNKLKAKDSKYVQIKLLWGFASWEALAINCLHVGILWHLSIIIDIQVFDTDLITHFIAPHGSTLNHTLTVDRVAQASTHQHTSGNFVKYYFHLTGLSQWFGS